MKRWERLGTEPAEIQDVRGVSRRTVARGAAWAAPVALVSVNAPAFAASASCLTATWTEAAYSGANGRWAFCFQFSNCGTAEIKMTQIQVFTTYHSPATNTALNQLVHTITTNTTVPISATSGDSLTYCSDKDRFDTPPRNGSANLLPGYYNDFAPTDTDGDIDCVADGKDDPPVFPTDPSYPDSCKRLRADNTFVVLTYTMSGVTSTETVYLDDNVGCRVTAGCD